MPTPEEVATQAEDKIIQERQEKALTLQQKALAEQRVEALTAKLKELGIDPDKTL